MLPNSEPRSRQRQTQDSGTQTHVFPKTRLKPHKQNPVISFSGRTSIATRLGEDKKTPRLSISAGK